MRNTPIITVVLVITAFFAGLSFHDYSSEARSAAVIFEGDIQKPANVDFTALWKAWNILDQTFVAASSTQEVSDEEKLWGAIQGLARAYGDPYTDFFPPEEAKNLEESLSGTFGGVGIEIDIKDDRLTVIAPLNGTPADRAGIKAGDKIMKIDGERTDGITLQKAVATIRGEVGTQVVLTVAREGVRDLIDIPVTRGIIEVPIINTELRGDGIFVIELYMFNANSSDAFRGALREFVQSGSRKMIIDLRDNPGGFLSSVTDITSWFLPAGKVIVTEDRGDDEDPVYHRSRGYNVFYDPVDIVVLVNEGSASASEIMTGALSEYGVATVVGTHTYGKGSVQEVFDITNDTTLKVTIAQWLTPNGNSISDGGITPDVVVENDPESERDLQLEKAVDILLQ